jgi:hypothetical protein
MLTTQDTTPRRSRMSSPTARAIVAVVGLGVLIGANYFLRHTLERSNTYIYSFLSFFYPAAEKELFAPTYPHWKLFLPIPGLGGSWTTTTLIVTHLVEMRLTPPVTWYVYNAALIVVSFLTSWVVFRSLVFSFTFAICMGFGTQLYGTYATPGSMSLYLLLMYYELALLCALRVVQRAAPAIVWRTAFATVVIVTAIAYESWLDFAVFMWLAGALVVAVAWRFDKRDWWPGLLFAGGWLGLVCIVYLYIKINFGYGQVVGGESDVVFNYPMLAPKIEDVVSNTLTQFHIAITNFLPPAFVSSTAFYSLGGDKLVELQHGYHPGFTYLVPMQYLFFWRYYASAEFVVFSYLLIRTLRKTLKVWSPDTFAVAIFLLMIATGGPTHAFVKARPMNSMPVNGYHVLVGVLGLALLLSCLARLAVTRFTRGGVGALLVAGMWATVFYSALSRPALLGHEAAQVGLGVVIYPNPQTTLAAMFGRSNPPVGGAEDYRLTRFTPALQAAVASLAPPAPVTFGGKLEPLPNTVSDLTKWTTAKGVTVTSSERGYRVVGNAGEGAYQLSSPLILVPANHRLLVRVQGTMEQGHACLGVLNQSERWLLPPATDRGELGVDTGNSQAVMFVFINCGRALGGVGASVFEVESVSYALLLTAEPGAAPRP